MPVGTILYVVFLPRRRLGALSLLPPPAASLHLPRPLCGCGRCFSYDDPLMLCLIEVPNNYSPARVRVTTLVGNYCERQRSTNPALSSRLSRRGTGFARYACVTPAPSPTTWRRTASPSLRPQPSGRRREPVVPSPVRRQRARSTRGEVAAKGLGVVIP